MERFEFETIGVVQSPFREKFGIPRQPRLVNAARAVVKLKNEPDMKDAVRDLDRFSHVWLITVFHGLKKSYAGPLVRPPRLGGAQKVGVFASRSPHRPNPIGISAVELERVDTEAPGGVELHIRGADILDGTPVLDIKPYIPYADSIPDADSGWAKGELPSMEVVFSPDADATCAMLEMQFPELRKLIVEVLGLDPRPSFQAEEEQAGAYAARILDFDIHWEVSEGRACVREIRRLPSS